MAVFMLMSISLACSLTDTTVGCNVPDLIDAINKANFNPAHSTLDLAEGCTYTLTAVDNTATSTFGGSTFEYGDNGLPQIATPITINGNNATIIRDSGAPHFRIFYIIETGSLTINDLTLDNGFADGSYPGGGSAFPGSGGAIYNDGSTLEINNCVLQNNQATFYGGAIFTVRVANTYLNGSTIQDNSAPHGGGLSVYHAGLLSIDDSEISNNTATTQGGGMSLGSNVELTIHNGQINSNHSARHGGGIFKDGAADSPPTAIYGTTFQGNTADWGGGGVSIWGTPLTISDTRFINNYANEYGGGLGYQSRYTETVTITKSTFEGNSTKWDGGAIHFSGELMNINGSTIRNNFAENGAGIHNGEADDPKYINRADTTLVITGSQVLENIAVGYGGGAFNEGVMSCGESDFSGNESGTLGGGIHNTGELAVSGCTFENNKTGLDGGGISSYHIAQIRASDFTSNTSTRGGGFASIGGDAVIRDSSFTGNASSESGGAIFNMGAIPGTSPMEIENCVISSNTAPVGGGIATSMGETGVAACTLSGNAANDGGGIYNGGLMEVIRSTLSANEASGSGGGILNLEVITVQESTFSGNHARQGGGLASDSADAKLTNNTFSANTASDAGGGLLISGSVDDTSPAGSMEASHITIAFNSAPAGGGIAISGGTLKIKNSILAKNTPGPDCGDSTGGLNSLGENMDSDGSCAGFTLTDDALLDVLANYGGPTETHALKTGSPAIDAAPDCTTTGGSALAADQRGEPRPGGPVCDLGAYEDKMGKPALKSPHVVFRQPLDCRLEPASSSIAITSFRPNDTAEVVGRNVNLTWYQVAPEGLGKLCWVWVGGVDFVGDLDSVEVIPSTPPVEKEEEERQQPAPSRSGCTVWNANKVLVCQVPCPPNAVPGDPCTP